LNAVLSGIRSLPKETEAYLQNIVPGLDLMPSAGSKITSRTVKQTANSHRNSPQNDLFFVRADAKISSGKVSTNSNSSENPPSQNASNSTKTSQSRETQRGLLFFPLAQTAH